MSLTIRRFVGGPIQTNAFLVASAATGDAIVIDAPGGTAGAIIETARQLGVAISQVIVTHGHWDHIQDLHAIQSELDISIAGSPGVRSRVEQPDPALTPVPIQPALLLEELREGDTVCAGGHAFTVMEMPGHDEAHIVLYSERDHLLFGGDVLFPGGHGRTDIPGSDQRIMNRTLRRFLDLPDDVQVFPGHGDSTTIAAERPWLKEIPHDE